MKVIFAGGGTGGHINPAISIADYAKSVDKDFEALFIGTRKGLEKTLVPRAGYKIEFIDIEGFDRKHLMRNVRVLKKLAEARKRCRELIRGFKPDCVVCTGGYVSGPVAMAAYKEGVSALIHEQNVYPGLTVRGSEKYVDHVAVSFDETEQFLKNKSKCVVTGNPIRSEILKADKNAARKKLGIKGQYLLIFGGSLGADRINETVVGMLPRFKENKKVQLLFGTGERNFEKVSRAARAAGIEPADKNITITPYINNMADVMAAADIVVSRSGAITVSEIAALAKPSILIPSPNVVRNHQEQNAREFEKHGAAEVITEAELTPELLYEKITSLLEDKEKLASMGDNLKKIAKTDALERIYELMLKMADKT